MTMASLESSLTQSSKLSLVSSNAWLTGTIALELESTHNVSGDKGCAGTQLTIASSVWLDSSIDSADERKVSLSGSISSLIYSSSSK